MIFKYIKDISPFFFLTQLTSPRTWGSFFLSEYIFPSSVCLYPKRTKPLNDKLVEPPFYPVSVWKEAFPYLFIFADFFQAKKKKKKLIKKRGNSLLPFKFSHAQWFLEHWTLVSAVVSSLPRWSIAVSPAVKLVPREARAARLYITRKGATHAVKKTTN